MKVVPNRRLKRYWDAWKRLAHKIGTFQARVMLTVLYATVVLPFGIVARLFSDPLRIKKTPEQWLPCSGAVSDIDSARKQ